MANLPDADELRALLVDALERHGAPGGAVALLVDGETVTACHGIADVSTGETLTPQHRFSIASITKPMVATVIAGLAEAGRFSLDDTVGGLVPELADSSWAARVTVRHLMGNLSGVPMTVATEWGASGTADTDLANHVATIGRGGPLAEPGQIWSYTNGGWAVLGRLIESVTGSTWESAMRRELFEPVGMAETGFANEPVAEPRALGHMLGAEGLQPTPLWGSRPMGPAGGSIFSTVTDLLRFASIHLASTPHLDALRTPQATVGVPAFVDVWGLGWGGFTWGTESVWGWDGIGPGHRAILRLLPASGSVYALTVNGDTGRAVNRTLLESLGPVLGGPGCVVPSIPTTPTEGAAGDLSRFAGRYAWPDMDIVVTAADGVLIHQSGGQKRELTPINATTFLADADDPDAATVSFGAFDSDGRPDVAYYLIWALRRTEAAT